MAPEKYLDKVLEGDCFDWLAQLPDDSVDLVLCDLPYGTTPVPPGSTIT